MGSAGPGRPRSRGAVPDLDLGRAGVGPQVGTGAVGLDVGVLGTDRVGGERVLGGVATALLIAGFLSWWITRKTTARIQGAS